MTFADLIKDILDASKARLKSPILGTYFVSFVVYNWKIFLVLFASEMTAQERIAYIEGNYNKWSVILWPIAISLIIVLCIPYITAVIEWLLGKSIKIRRGIRFRHRDDMLSDEMVLARKEYALGTIRSGTTTIKEMQDEIELLKKEKANLINTSQVERTKHLDESATFQEKLTELSEQLERFEFKRSDKLIARSIENPEVAAAYDRLYFEKQVEAYYQDFLFNLDQIFPLNNRTQALFIELRLVQLNEGFTYRYSKFAGEVFLYIFDRRETHELRENVAFLFNKLTRTEKEVLITLPTERFFHSDRKKLTEGTLDLLVKSGFVVQLNEGWMLTAEGRYLRGYCYAIQLLLE